MKTEKFILPASIVLGCMIIGIFLYAIQANKQAGIDRKLTADILEKREADEKIRAREQKIENCISDAEDEYWRYMELNGTKNEETGVIKAPTFYWDTAKKDKQDSINNCYKK